MTDCIFCRTTPNSDETACSSLEQANNCGWFGESDRKAYLQSRAPAQPAKETKLVYIKRWRTLVELPLKYADEIRDTLAAQPAAPVETDAVEGELDTIVQLIHKHVGIRQRIDVDLTGVEDAAKAILAASHSRSSAGRETELLATLVYEAMRFAIWAAGQGIMPDEGEPAQGPEDFLYEYSCALEINDWEGLAEVARDHVRAVPQTGGK